MGRHHKWFRNERRKHQLEYEVNNHKTYYSNVYFITKEPDTRDIREHTDYILWIAEKFDLTAEEALDRYIEQERKYGNGRFIYTKRPEVPYSVQYYNKPPRRSRHQKELKKRTARRLRHYWKQKGEVYQHNNYRRVQEFWWELD